MDINSRVEELHKKRLSGELPDWKNLTDDKFIELCEEGIGTAMLSYIFTISKGAVYNRRCRLGKLARDIIIERVISDINKNIEN